MLEITSDDVGRLTDADLRELIVRLCEAELVAAGLPSSALTAGGPQDAPDGGIDVRVDSSGSIESSGYIPRGKTGFQVKASPMPPKALVNEMRPGGTLRESISDLLGGGGAYVVVCSKASPTDSRLAVVKAAMLQAAGGPDSYPQGLIDFMGADRVALWCRGHPGVAAWARQTAGRPTEGWLPYGNWSRPAEGVEPEFILDEEARLVDERAPQDGTLSIEVGLERIRALATEHRSSIRLVGLSGVGKTRLIQAVFDSRIGNSAIARHRALYCDYGTPVSPTPTEMARQLVARRSEAVLLIDNCSPEIHRTLSAIIAVPESRVSLLTVEYDVRDDDMEGTEVFRLEPASDDVTVALIKRRFPHINTANRRRLADIAGGNARIALALAHTVRKGESLGRLRDDGLFERLFFQRNQPDPALLAAAEVASLVYSFDGEHEGDGGELQVLALLASQTVQSLKMACAELARRDLLQKRAHWRAVLPHAVANRLAGRALDRMDLSMVGSAMEAGGNRLLRSFSRRLAFLHDVPQAQRLAADWFSPEGRLGRIDAITDDNFSLFRNLAPLAPEAALEAISRGAHRDPAWSSFRPYYAGARSRQELASLVRSLAFEPHMFDEAASRLVEIAIADSQDERQQSNKTAFEGLFKLYMSGTMAGPKQRLAFIWSLLRSGQEAKVDLGMSALDSMLETRWFGSVDSFDFGARPRSFGWEPSSPQDMIDWFEPTINVLKDLAVRGLPIAVRARQILAARFRGMWWRTNSRELLGDVMGMIADRSFWSEGWIAVRSAIRFAPEGADVGDLAAIEARLRPKNLLEQARAYGFSKGHASQDLEDLDEDEEGSWWHRAEKRTEQIAQAVAIDDEVRIQLLPDLVRSGLQRHWSFGTGLALGAVDPEAVWHELVRELRSALPDDPEPAVLRSFLRGWFTRAPEVVETVLDQLLHDPELGRWFPFFQTAIHPLNPSGVVRLLASLDLGIAPSGAYHPLVYGRVTDGLEPADFARLLQSIAAKEGGPRVAVEILHMRLHADREKPSIDPIIREVGRHLLATYPLGTPHGREDARLSELALVALSGKEGSKAADRLLRRLKVAVTRYHAHGYEYDDLVATIFKVQPRVALDFFLERQFRPHQGRYARTLLHTFDHMAKPITHAPDEDLLAWAADGSEDRYRRVAECIPIFVGKEPDASDSADRWWPPALALLEAAPNRAEVLAEYDHHVHPRSWSGSLAEIFERRRNALMALDSHSDPVVRDWSLRWQSELADRIPYERSRESRRDQSFE